MAVPLSSRSDFRILRLVSLLSVITVTVLGNGIAAVITDDFRVLNNNAWAVICRQLVVPCYQ